MELMTVDGKIVFFVKQFTMPEIALPQSRKFIRYKTGAKKKIFSRNEAETAKIREVLSQEGISFTEEDISPTQAMIQRAKAIEGKNLTRSKALRLLQSDFPAEVLGELRKIKYSQVDSYIEKLSDLQSLKAFLKKLTKVVLTLIKKMED